jgi:hypothetical protein
MPEEGQDIFIVKARCVSKRGCIRENFSREYNEVFTTRLPLLPGGKKIVKTAQKNWKGKMTDLDVCRLIAPKSIEVLEVHVSRETLPRTVKEQVSDPPLPGQDGFDSKPLARQIQEHSQALDHRKEHHWEEDGSPSRLVLSEWIGADVSKEQIAAAVPNMKRRTDSS